ncbi:ATP synthase [Mrakia frigida]|uniref:F1F0 ATP synthase subunit 4 n=1 Tax=Mrakia frigida TaxID=29902 RepID=UPI003FCC0FDB
MASKLLATSLRSAARPSVVAPAIRMSSVAAGVKLDHPATPTFHTQTPEEKASALLEAVPEVSWATKTGTVLGGVALAAIAVSQEFYVVNSETIIFVATMATGTLLIKGISGPFDKWCEFHNNKKLKILTEARQGHYDAVANKIDQISLLSDSVQTTKDLYALSKQTAEYEAANFVLKQENALNTEAKAVLDSWVRHEQQVRESEQAQLVKTIQANVLKSIADPKFKKELIASALADIEKMINAKQV